MLYAPRSEDTFFIMFKEIITAYEAQNITMEYLDTKILPEKAKAVYNGNGSPYISSVNYYDTNGRLYAKWFTNDEVHYYVEIYDYLEDLEEINKVSHREAIEYHFEFKVKDYTYRVDGKPLNEINTDIDTGKYIIHINNGNAKAQEYGYRLDTEFIPYYITDNALITYNTDENECKKIMANICEVLKELPLDYRKCDLTMLIPTENYEIKIGDIIEVTNKIGKKFKMMVMEISIDSSGITYSSFGEINYPVEGDNITSQIIYLEDTRRELNNVIDDMGYVAEDLININDKFDDVDNSINNLNNSITNTDNKLNNYITTNNNRVDALGEAVNGTAQSIVDLSNLTKEFKSSATSDGLATINLTNTLTGVVLDSRLQAQTTALLNAINGKCSIVYMTHDNNENIPQKGYALNIGKSDLYISICNFDLSSTMTVSTVYLYFFIIMNNKIISRGRFNAMN